MLTLSTFGMDTRSDLPKVSYVTALDWFVLMSFSFVSATLLEFATVHYFTKIGFGELPTVELDEEDDEKDHKEMLKERDRQQKGKHSFFETNQSVSPSLGVITSPKTYRSAGELFGTGSRAPSGMSEVIANSGSLLRSNNVQSPLPLYGVASTGELVSSSRTCDYARGGFHCDAPTTPSNAKVSAPFHSLTCAS